MKRPEPVFSMAGLMMGLGMVFLIDCRVSSGTFDASCYDRGWTFITGGGGLAVGYAIPNPAIHERRRKEMLEDLYHAPPAAPPPPPPKPPGLGGPMAF